jgi:hypothetical protein
MLRTLFRGSLLPLLCLLLCLGLPACHRDVQAPGDPVAAVKGLVAAVRDNDLVRYSRLSVPPELFDRQAQRWQAAVAAAPPPTDAERRDYARWMKRLTEPQAEDKLFRSLNSRMGKVDPELKARWPLMKASAEIFLKGLIQASDSFGPDQKAHAMSLGSALLAGIDPERLADRDQARAAVKVLVATAREVDLPTLDSQRKLGMVQAMAKGSIALKGLKRIGLLYGLDIDTALAGVQAKVVAADGELATLEVSYPLLGQTVQFETQLIRRNGRWYRADAVRDAEAELALPLPSAAKVTP